MTRFTVKHRETLTAIVVDALPIDAVKKRMAFDVFGSVHAAAQPFEGFVFEELRQKGAGLRRQKFRECQDGVTQNSFRVAGEQALKGKQKKYVKTLNGVYTFTSRFLLENH
ncbi:hypothetical protein RUM43_006891 [Polyplax serrata]|uniref:Uncharacterized protein n=1 Tax=Polyplax serrata TaxID=468196 RepID=A0AAN8P4Z9_POLSC